MTRDWFSLNAITLLVLSQVVSSSIGANGRNNLQIRQNRFQIPTQSTPELTNRIIPRESFEEEPWLSSVEADIELDEDRSLDSEADNNRHHARATSDLARNSRHHLHHHPNLIVKEQSVPRIVDCPGCVTAQRRPYPTHPEELSEEGVRNLRLERIKLKILKKLRLKAPPKNVSGVKDLPDPFLTMTYHQSHNNRHSSQNSGNNDMDDFYGKTEQVIVFAEEENPGGSSSCQVRRSIPSACLTFKLPNEVVKEKVDLRATSAELWVYTFEEDSNFHRVFTIAEISTSDQYNGPKATSLDPRHTLNSTDGWEAMNVSSTVGAWMNKTLHFRLEREHPALTLQIGCRNCSKVDVGSTSPIDISNPQHRPFLVINMAEKIQKSRRRRNTNCHSSGPTECCRESFKVSFSEIGWDWIRHPKEFDAYYCRGRCGGMRAAHHHTSAMQAQINIRNRTASAFENAALIPCCTPKKLSGITIIVSLTNNTSETKDLPNMVVDSCGCAGEEDIS